jgi:hypothetical protein
MLSSWKTMMNATLFLLMLAADWKSDAVFRATFDGSTDAVIGAGDRRLYTAADGYKAQAMAKPGLAGAPVEHVATAGRNGGGALRFTKQNRAAVFYKAEGNVPFDAKNWTGTISFWLKLDPETELEPGFCDPIQVTDKAYNDSAIWVDFTKDDKPRHFRLGVFGALTAWNPQKLESDKNPAFNNRLVVVRKTPFARDRWTHIAITFERLGSGNGIARLYLDGKLQGASPTIGEPFEWDLSKGAIRLGVSYVGLMDDVAIFRRALNAKEIRALSRW